MNITQLEGDLAYESLAHHWELVLNRDSNFPEDLIPKVSAILAQDEILGTDARTSEQKAIIGKALTYGNLPR